MLASRLGYRITGRFFSHFLGKIFDNPNTVFTTEIPQPERQDLGIPVEGISYIVEVHRRVSHSVTSMTRVSTTPARRCAHCCTSWRPATTGVWMPNTRIFVICSVANTSRGQTGTASAWQSSSNATYPSGSTRLRTATAETRHLPFAQVDHVELEDVLRKQEFGDT